MWQIKESIITSCDQNIPTIAATGGCSHEDKKVKGTEPASFYLFIYLWGIGKAPKCHIISVIKERVCVKFHIFKVYTNIC